MSNSSHYLIFKHKFKINILVIFLFEKNKLENKQIKTEIYSRKIIQDLKLTN